MKLCALERQSGKNIIPREFVRVPASIFDSNGGYGVTPMPHTIKSDPTARLWCLQLGDEGPGRWLTKLAVTNHDTDLLTCVEITDSRAGLVKLRACSGRSPTDSFCIVDLRPDLPERGGISYAGDVIGWRRTERSYVAQLGQSPWVPVAIGEVGLGATGTFHGHGEHMVACLPRGAVGSVCLSGRLTREQRARQVVYYYWDGAALFVMSAEERETFSERGLVPAILPTCAGPVAGSE